MNKTFLLLILSAFSSLLTAGIAHGQKAPDGYSDYLTDQTVERAPRSLITPCSHSRALRPLVPGSQ
jgi:hypothetical protein